MNRDFSKYGPAEDIVSVRLDRPMMGDIKRTQAVLQAHAPGAAVTQTDAVRYLIKSGVESEFNHNP